MTTTSELEPAIINPNGKLAQVALIVRPENQVPKRRGPLRLPMPRDLGKPSKGAKSGQVTMSGEFLGAGTQFVALEQYEAMTAHPIWQQLLALNVIEVVSVPGADDSDQTTGLTHNYDLTQAYRLVANSADIEWLQSSKRKESRRDVTMSIDARIAELEDMSSNREDSK